VAKWIVGMVGATALALGAIAMNVQSNDPKDEYVAFVFQTGMKERFLSMKQYGNRTDACGQITAQGRDFVKYYGEVCCTKTATHDNFLSQCEVRW
jgi:hypothetical protein